MQNVSVANKLIHEQNRINSPNMQKEKIENPQMQKILSKYAKIFLLFWSHEPA